MWQVLLFAVVFGLAADPAQAGPVGGAIAAVGAAIKGSAIMSAVARMGVSMALSAIARKLGPKPQDSRASTDVKVDVAMGDDLPLTFTLGDYATAGRRKYIGSWGRNLRFVTDVIEVSALPQPGLAAIWIGDERGGIDLSKLGVVSGAPGSVEAVTEQSTALPVSGYSLGHPVDIGPLSGRRRIWVRWVDGTQTVVDPLLAWAFGSDADYPWSGIGTGKSYAIVTLQYDQDGMSALPALLFQPEPLPLYDPRKDGSTGGTGAHRWGDRATYEPSRNAAVIAYNVARGIYFGSEWVFGGRNLPAWRLPRAEWVAAMAACDRAIALAGGGTEPAYRAGLEISVDQSGADVLEAIGRAANMRFAEVGGQLKPLVDLPAAPVFSITDGDIVVTEGQSFTPFYPVSQTFNAISASYPEPGEKWATKDAPQRIDAVATAEDGGRYLPTSVSYPACPWGTQVQRLMLSQMSDYRRMRQHSMTLSPEAWALEPMDMISWTSGRNGYADKKFLVEMVTKLPGLSVVLALREVDPEDYDWDSDLELPVVITPPVNPVPFTQTISGFAVVPVLLAGDDTLGRRAGLQISCSGAEAGVGQIRIQIEQGGDLQFDMLRPYAAPHVWTVTDIVAGTTYRVRAALVSDLSPRFTWSPWITVTTQAVPVWAADLSAEIREEFEEMANAAGIALVDALPAEGERPDQIVMLAATKQLWRWDAEAEGWSDQIEVAIGDGKVLSQHIAANNILAGHVAAGQIDATHLNTESLSVAGLAVFGGELKSGGFVAGASGWRIKEDGAAEFNDVTLRGTLRASRIDPSEPLLFDAGSGRLAPLGVYLFASGTGPASGAVVEVNLGTLYGPTWGSGFHERRLSRGSIPIVIDVNLSHANTSGGSMVVEVSIDGGSWATIYSVGPSSFGANAAFAYTAPASFSTLQFRAVSSSNMRVTSLSLKATAFNW
ncbi:phage tail protein [Falsigemmobacter faecalis]|uniref:Tip attachment protein J domain-containing protein n=1 Tax=Falsigemmobacter faecalis TaxID=2488730 RepID=A0A3P3DHD5_9RHOB|nr:phage tail protein [Falsigemmobacter faecalis]RRH71988.1 hypothetical protein EG244_15860 [Falsigemmobacter faecalis]